MKEIGGFIQLDQYHLPMLHEEALDLNCGRSCLAYLIRARKIKKIALPYFLCDSINSICQKEGIEITYYHIKQDFLPEEVMRGNKNIEIDEDLSTLSLKSDQWLYLVNYYGQLSNAQIREIARNYPKIIVDQAQAYYQKPLVGIDTLYTCRKFFGVADGGFLYTNAKLDGELPLDESYERMHFLLGRYERTANEFYGEYTMNNQLFGMMPIKRMSKLTKNLLHGIDYSFVKQRRNENFTFLDEKFYDLNRLKLKCTEGAYMYPLYIKYGDSARKKLQEKKIYIPILWPSVLKWCSEGSLEFDMAQNILPLPIDQRYGKEDMQYLTEEVMECIN